jgi:nucleoid-associated protein YgaU
MRHLLAFALLLLIGGGIGWLVYEWQRQGVPPPADEAARVATGPKTDAVEPAQAVTAEGGQARKEQAAPSAGAGSEARREAVAEGDAAPATPASEPAASLPAPERRPTFEPPRVVAPLPEVSDPAELARAEPEGTADAAERSLGLEAIRRALSRLLGEGGGPDREAAPKPPERGAAQKALADLKGDPDSRPEPPAVAKPSFDIVRIGRDGTAVMAGRAEPGAEVEIRVGERVLDRVVATRRGSWVSTPPEPIKAGDRELSLAARIEGKPLLVSDQIVVVAVPEGHSPQPPERTQAGLPPPETAVVGAEAGAGPASTALPIAAARGPDDPMAVLMRKDDAGTGRVLQAPGRISSDGELALLVLDYDDSGRVRLSGEGPPGAPVRIYVDNRPAGEFSVAQDGTWRAVLHERLEAGTYTLRLDQLDAAGKPTARLETPFTRANRPPVAGEAEVDYVIVQPGNSLWRISRRLFGNGFKHVHIFEANRGQIRDPDLIYPGQVFEVPAGVNESG